MNCMKCGQKVKGQQVFCEDCLAIMETYPVKPGTPIQLPPPPPKNPAPVKVNKRRPKKPEEIILQLRSKVRLLTLALIVAMLAFIATAVMLLWLLENQGFDLSFWNMAVPF